jgi:methylated-DNA-[protein]-cysteine S-methyltransferase
LPWSEHIGILQLLQEATAFELQLRITQFLRLSLDCRIINSCFSNLSFKKLTNYLREMKFQEKVWQVMKKIPKGKVTTYRIIAHKLGTNAYRAVGTAVKNNPYAPKIPCHRVVKSDGIVGFYSAKGGVKTKIKLLEKEGIKIKRKRVVDFEKVLYKF